MWCLKNNTIQQYWQQLHKVYQAQIATKWKSVNILLFLLHASTIIMTVFKDKIKPLRHIQKVCTRNLYNAYVFPYTRFLNQAEFSFLPCTSVQELARTCVKSWRKNLARFISPHEWQKRVFVGENPTMFAGGRLLYHFWMTIAWQKRHCCGYPSIKTSQV